MSTLGTILIADDDETFRSSTADLLRRDGYECDEAPDGPSATERLGHRTYDLLIADIVMPGNTELELVRAAPQIVPGLPILVVTAYPSMETAAASVELPVSAYLVKPVELEELRRQVGRSVVCGRAYRNMSQTRQRLAELCGDMQQTLSGLSKAGGDAAPVSVEMYLSLCMQNIMGGLLDVHSLATGLLGAARVPNACHLMNCPRGQAYRRGIKDAISVLQKTKNAFKSKELAQLRQNLEQLIEADDT